MKKSIPAVGAALLLAASTVPAAHAGSHSISYSSCTYVGYGYASRTDAKTSGFNCNYTQARIKRVINGLIVEYNGQQGLTSTVTASNGYLYANYHLAPQGWYNCS